MCLRAQHSVTEALRLTLANEVDIGECARCLDGLELGHVALLRQVVLKLGHGVEVVGKSILVAADDHQNVGDSRLGGFLNDVLDRGLINDRKHLLRHRLGGGKKTGPQTRRRDDGLDVSA